jgi:hypothetical protein
VFELYYPADEMFFALVERSVPRWSAEITLESPSEERRRCNGKFPWSNAAVERTIQSALAHGCRKLDVFFMVGLPHQTRAEALAIPSYCEHLLRRFGRDGRVRPFVAPLGPFLDPGSRAFEQREFGYSTFARTLEEHRQAFLQHSWQRILSYETDGLTRDEVASTTYEIAGRLNHIKREYGLIDDETFTAVARHLEAAREILDADRSPDGLSRLGLDAEQLRRQLALANCATMFGDRELSWPVRRRFRVGATLLRGLAKGLVEEIGHTAARLVGRYDVAPVTGGRSGAVTS